MPARTAQVLGGTLLERLHGRLMALRSPLSSADDGIVTRVLAIHIFGLLRRTWSLCTQPSVSILPDMYSATLAVCMTRRRPSVPARSRRLVLSLSLQLVYCTPGWPGTICEVVNHLDILMGACAAAAQALITVDHPFPTCFHPACAHHTSAVDSISGSGGGEAKRPPPMPGCLLLFWLGALLRAGLPCLQRGVEWSAAARQDAHSIGCNLYMTGVELLKRVLAGSRRPPPQLTRWVVCDGTGTVSLRFTAAALRVCTAWSRAFGIGSSTESAVLEDLMSGRVCDAPYMYRRFPEHSRCANVGCRETASLRCSRCRR